MSNKGILIPSIFCSSSSKGKVPFQCDEFSMQYFTKDGLSKAFLKSLYPSNTSQLINDIEVFHPCYVAVT